MECTLEGEKMPLMGISIVVPTRNRINYVKKLLNSLNNELKSFNKPTEVIIVDSSESKESEAIFEICRKYSYKFYHLRASISQARNYGIDASKFPIILFIDSDCEVVSGLLEEHLTSYTDDSIGGVLGLTNFTGEENWVWKIVQRTSFIVPFSFAQKMDYAPWGPCANISFRKSILSKIGGFRTDRLFGFSGEDVDIGLRINKLGYKIKCNSKAVVLHNKKTWSNFTELCRKIFRWGRAGFHILTQHSYLSQIDLPKFTTVSLFIAAFAILYGLLTMKWKMMWNLAVWLLCVPAINALLRSSGFKSKVSSFVFNYCAFWLSFLYELGSVYESIKNRSLLMFYKRHFYGSGQLLFEWRDKLIQNWSFIISLIILIFISAFT